MKFEMGLKMIRLYVDQPLKQGSTINLSENQYHYLKNVMRLKDGETVLLFHGDSGEFESVVTLFKKYASAKICYQTREPLLKKQRVKLYFSPLKNHRTDFLLEKATELGADDLYPSLFRNTNAQRFNHEKAQNHIMEAAEQCERLDLPELHTLRSFADHLKELSKDDQSKDSIILFCDELEKVKTMSDVFKGASFKDICIIVGPEGGIHQDERNILKKIKSAQGIMLSQQILRSETAVIAALSQLQLFL